MTESSSDTNSSRRQRIAVIGTGVSGLTAAHFLSENHDITVYEANDYIGGHTATKTVTVDSGTYAVDTGFIVYNDWTYPNFIKLLSKLKVDTQPTEMSFSVHNEASGLEYNGHNLNTLFAQRRNFFSPTFYRLIRDILKFNKLCKAALTDGTDIDNLTLIEFIKKHELSETFSQNYILPMCAAIWSTSLEKSGDFPLRFFLQFFNNHGLLNVADRPQWYTIIGGSHSYIEPLIEPFKSNIRLSSPVQKVVKTEGGYTVHAMDKTDSYDQVIFACHSDQALNCIDTNSLSDEHSDKLKDVLGAIPYAMNEVVLHTDTALMPERKLAWASWNYRLKGTSDDSSSLAKVSYNMNILQRLNAPETFVVSLNDTSRIAKEKILGTYHYAHPQFTPDMVKAQQKRSDICGVDGLHFCGAYWYNGFHEDGVRSALDVCKRFGVEL